MPKVVKTGSEVVEKLTSGVSKAADTIAVTVGPTGKCVALPSMMGPEITRDGATVAKSLEFEDPIENMAAEMIRLAASSTESKAGDGTSSTSILIKEMYVRGQKAIKHGSNVNEIKSGMLKAEAWMKNYIRSRASEINGLEDIDKLRNIATISANNDPEVGELVVEGMQKVGLDGLVTVDAYSSLDTTIEVTTGMKLNRGWVSPLYINNQVDGTCVMENAAVLVVGDRLSSVNQLVNVLSAITDPSNGSVSPLLLVCDEIDDAVNSMLFVNVQRGSLRCCVVKGIDFGDGRKNQMADLAVATGATFFCPENGNSVNHATLADLGMAGKVVVSRDHCIIRDVKGDPQAISDRAEIIKARLADPTISDYDKDKFKKRLANLSGGVAVIKAGGGNEIEQQNRKATIEDSVLAAKSALEEGYCPGAGSVYLNATREVQKDSKFWKGLVGDETEGAKVVFDSLPIILKTVSENSGLDGNVAVERAKRQKNGFGYNAKTKKQGVDLLKDGILDSAKVLRVALENSISSASMLLLTERVVYEVPNENK